MRRILKGLLALLLVSLLFLLYVLWGLPSRSAVRALERKPPEQTGLMRQREEEARAKGKKAARVQRWIPLGRMSRHLIQATLASEDQNFFGHEGVDWKALQESVEITVKKRRFLRGGSTLTQQLAKNLFFDTRKNPVRKLRELIVAWWLEDDLSKRRILELYLNVIEWGDGVYGAEAAALRWYGKSADALTLEEAAGLVAMIPNPRRINPKASPERHARSQRRVLRLMARAGFIERSVAGMGANPVSDVESEARDNEE
jgi:monofunctional biosynthetic peptidoglycan transglycosylase